MRVLILICSDVGLFRFRKELPMELLHPGSYLPERAGEDAAEVYIALPKGPYIPQLEEMGCKYIEVDFERRSTNPLKDLRLFTTYLRILKKVKPQVVLTYTIKPNVYGGMACRLLSIPHFPNITGLGASMEHPGLLRQLSVFLSRFGMAKSRTIFFQNQANMDFMLNHGVCGKGQSLLPGSGVNLDAHAYCEYPSETSAIRFLTLIRIMETKGIRELLACAERVKKAHPNVTFSLAGDFDDDRYRAAVEEAQQQGWIEYLGFRHDVEEQIRQHHCIIHPSYFEGVSNTLLEAAACGRPIIASNVPGCMEAFDEGVSGFGFEKANADMLAQCVERFINMPHEDKAKMGRAGRRKVEGQFDRKIVIRKYIEHVESVVH